MQRETSYHSTMVSALGYKLEGCQFESHKSHKDFSDSSCLLPRVRLLQAHWEDWGHSVKLHPLYKCDFENGAQITRPTLQLYRCLYLPGLVDFRIHYDRKHGVQPCHL